MSNGFGRILLLAVCFLAGGCVLSEEGEIKETIDDLMAAVNERDQGAASRLYVDGSFLPVMPSGDSSAIFRMMYSGGGSDFEPQSVESVIRNDSAQTTFYVTGKVRRNDTVAGTMMIRLLVTLARVDGEWRIVPGSERQLPGG